jgi:hypothetical protein
MINKKKLTAGQRNEITALRDGVISQLRHLNEATAALEENVKRREQLMEAVREHDAGHNRGADHQAQRDRNFSEVQNLLNREDKLKSNLAAMQHALKENLRGITNVLRGHSLADGSWGYNDPMHEGATVLGILEAILADDPVPTN